MIKNGNVSLIKSLELPELVTSFKIICSGRSKLSKNQRQLVISRINYELKTGKITKKEIGIVE